MRLLSAVFLSTLVAYIYCAPQCPQPEKLPSSCSCTIESWSLKVSCSGDGEIGIQEIVSGLKKQFPSTTEIGTLNLGGFRDPDALSSRIFQGLRIKVLRIINCRFQRWADRVGGPAFVGLEDSLKELHILSSIYVSESYRGQTEVPAPFSLGHLRQVTKVKIFRNRLYVFGKDWFGSGGSSVDELDIEQNEIHVMGEDAMVGLTSMRNFKAELNHLRELTRSMFPPKSKLVLLDVRHNKLEGFPEDFFVDFPSLNKIELNGNPIMFVPEHVFGKIWTQLNYIDFKDTHLHCDNHIDWMLKVRQPRSLYGWCETPATVSGKALSTVLYQRRNQRSRGGRWFQDFKSIA